MATSPKIMYGSTQMQKVMVGSTEMYDVNVVQNGVTTRVYHKHTSACYSAGHKHGPSCYDTPTVGYGLCGWCGWEADYSINGSTCPKCGMYPCYPQAQLICTIPENASTLICGYNV